MAEDVIGTDKDHAEEASRSSERVSVCHSSAHTSPFLVPLPLSTARQQSSLEFSSCDITIQKKISSGNVLRDPTDLLLISRLKCKRIVADTDAVKQRLDAAEDPNAAAHTNVAHALLSLRPRVSQCECYDGITEVRSGVGVAKEGVWSQGE
ncbi:hypothetical protein Baya_6991 [Bagarius yarrelli]|uniref:Uncharacterized protein n=1 Tax=Bagarius yarrelli TaxID=175774 RepID=A0A556U3H1_BAGYA|nr:hypothetical protein Baya_6991 [Bagarius yarrelli]